MLIQRLECSIRGSEVGPSTLCLNDGRSRISPVRKPRRAALSTYAGPIPRPVVPIWAFPRAASCAASNSRWAGVINWAASEMNNRSGETSTPASRQHFHFLHQGGGIDHHAIPQTADGLRMNEPGGDNVEFEDLLTDRHGVAGIIPAIVAGRNICFFLRAGQPPCPFLRRPIERLQRSLMAC